MYVGKPPTGSAVVAYTVPSGKTAIVKNIVLCNVINTAATINIWISGLAIVYTLTVQPYDTVTIDLSTVMDAGDQITAQQGTANAIEVHISGVEVA